MVEHDPSSGSCPGSTAPRAAHPVGADDAAKLCPRSRAARAIRRGMPEMQHAGREPAVLAPDAGVQQADHQVGILLAPADDRLRRIRRCARGPGARPPDCTSGSLPSAAPLPCASAPSGKERAGSSRLTSPRRRWRRKVGKDQHSAAARFAQHVSVSERDNRMRLPATNQPGSARRRCAATKSGRGRQSPSRKTQ